jgi:CMP-N,N'-diacetyllegionaminic acid synthase
MLKPKIYAIIPARSGSKGVPSKNIRKLGKHPLIAYSIIAAKKTPGIDRVIVSTDSEEYANISKEYGAEVPFLRPSEISGDRSSDLECMQHALDFFKKAGEQLPTHLIHLRPTSPLRETQWIEQAIQKFTTKIGFTALRSVHEMSETAYKCFEVDLATDSLVTVFEKNPDIEKSNVGRQLFPKTYSPNGYVDILSVEFMTKQGKIHGDKVMSLITPTMIEVDSLKDFELLDYELANDTNNKYSIYK